MSTASSDSPAISTWGDVSDVLPEVDLPADVDESDGIRENQLDEWIEGVIGQIDADDFETLRALPDDVSPSEHLRLIGQYAARGEGEGAPAITDDGEQRENAHAPWTGKYGGVPDSVVEEKQRTNASVEDVPTGGDPFGSEEEADADRSPMRTDGAIRANASDSPDVSTGASPFGAPADRSNSRSPFSDSVEEKLDRVSDTAAAIYEKLEADGPETSHNIAVESGSLSQGDARRAFDQLRELDLIEKASSKNPPRYEPVADSRPDSRSGL